MRNQPKYNFFKNSSYAVEGLVDVIKSERSFQIELVFFVLMIGLILCLDFTLTIKLILFISSIGLLIAEVINSSIERVVDLVTLEIHPMAKKAKDAGSAIVFLSITQCVVVWGVCLIDYFFKGVI